MDLNLSPSQTEDKPSLQDWEGKLDLDNEAYHALEGYVSSTTLKEMIKSPAHFKAIALDGVKKESTAFNLGSCAHEMILEGDDTQFIAIPDFKPQGRLTKKKQVQDFKEHHPGKRFVTLEQKQTLQAMFKKAKSNDLFNEYLCAEGNVIEQAYAYLDEKSGIRCKFKPDMWNPGQSWMLDYKTTEDASPWGFRKTIARYHYHISAIHYLVGTKRLFGDVVNKYVFVAQEKSPPYAIGVYVLEKNALVRAAKQRRELLTRIGKCISKNNFPDYTEKGELGISPPDYAFELE